MGLGAAQLTKLFAKELPKIFRYVENSIRNPKEFPQLSPIDLAKKFKSKARPKTIYKYSQDKAYLKEKGISTRLDLFNSLKTAAAVKKRPATTGVKYTTAERKVLDTQRGLKRRKDNPEKARLQRLAYNTSPAGRAAIKRARDKRLREGGKREYGRTEKDNLWYDLDRSAQSANGRLEYIPSSLPKDGNFTRAAMKNLKFRDKITGKEITYKNLEKFYDDTFGKGSIQLAYKPMRQLDYIQSQTVKNTPERLTGVIQRGLYKDQIGNLSKEQSKKYMQLAIFNRHHKEGVATNPFFSELTSATGNSRINALEQIYASKLDNAIKAGAGKGEQKTIIKEFSDLMSQDHAALKAFNKKHGYMPLIPGGGESSGIVGGITVGRPIENLKNVLLETSRFAKKGRQTNPSIRKLEIPEELKKDGGRVEMDEGGRVGMQIGGSPKPVGNIGGGRGEVTIGGPTNKVGTIQSMLAGIGAGIIDIPRGAFTLGAALMDLGLGTNNAAKVEQWFDDLTGLDEMTEDNVMGGMVRVLVNLGIPGAAAWRMGEKVTRKALLHKRNGNYFKITDPKLEERMKTALNAKGRMAATLGAAGAAGVSDAIFIGDPESVGTMGDLFGGGPTQLTPNDSTEASREVINRLKFGVDGALFLGLIGGTGSAVKSVWKRRDDLNSSNDALDKFLSKLRPRGAKPQEFFELERANIGFRAADVNYASEIARKLDKHIDAIFPFVKNPFNKMGNKGRTEFMDELNETLLSGKIDMEVTGKSAFGAMDPDRVAKITKLMKDRGAKQADIDGVLDSFEQMRLGWSHMFSRLGYSMKDADPKVLEEFRGIIGDKFKSYLGSTYEIFQNKSLIPLLNYAPTEEAVTKAVKMVQDSARTAGKSLTDEEARHFVDKMVESARLPRGLSTSKEKSSGIFLEVPDFFANKTVLSDLEFNPKIALDSLTPDARKVIDEVLGKVSDPMQTMLAGSGRLSLITRRNQFYEELMKKSADDIAAGKKGFFHESELDAFKSLGGNIKQIEIDPTRTIEAGITNPLNGKWAEKGVAEAIEESAMLARDKGTIRQMYDSLVLYPKATSQIAKTILSPITHVRNFVSAGAFAGANGLIPGLVSPTDMAAAMKDAYKALQIPGARMANDAYRDLLRLGVVNSNVRLGDLQRLLKDVSFGETLTAQKGLRGLMRPLSKAKKWTEQMYTAEDDFWKITSYALERQRLNKAYSKYGIKVADDALNEEAASIVRNNIPNYDMVNDFIKGLRQLPFGNFVSFPAEIMRTSTNILGRALKEINYAHTLDDGRVVNPLRGIGYKRLFGFGTTVVGVPYGTVEAAKAIYDVSEDEMEAMRRFVPDWSKNSTLVPIRDDETGELKYVDFSHANAYDTMIRPINTMINSVNQGIDEGEIMKSVATGMFAATAETLSPFVSESIWTEAASDIFLRGGRTREGRRLWTEATPWGERVSLTAGHLVKTQMPGSIAAINRMGLSIREEVDEYGRSYELGDELAGIAGFRAVKLDPIRSMKFKIADFRTGINAARREFTSPLLKGGPVNPADIVDRFEVANQAAYNVQQEMFKDYYAARTLGAGQGALDLQFADRISNVQLNAIKSGRFKPFIPSENIMKAFADNARAIGERNAYLAAQRQIQNMIKKYNNLPLWGGFAFPRFENPFIGSAQASPQAAINTGTPQVIATPPGINPAGVIGGGGIQQRGQQVFGTTDPIFGVG